MEKLLLLFKETIRTLLTEKFRAFRSGFFAGGAISLPFLFGVPGFSRDLIWIFPLKLLMSTTFAFSTGLAAQAAKYVALWLKNKYFKTKNNDRKSKQSGQDQDNRDSRAA